jgi:CRISPR-associated protein Cas6
MVMVDLSFGLRGSEIPVDHGYALFSAISRLLPFLHGDEKVGIHPISGLLIGHRLLRITEKSRLVFRIDSEQIRDVIMTTATHSFLAFVGMRSSGSGSRDSRTL